MSWASNRCPSPSSALVRRPLDVHRNELVNLSYNGNEWSHCHRVWRNRLSRPPHRSASRGRTRLQPAHVEDVAEAIARVMQRAETTSSFFELGGPRIYSYEQFLRAVAHGAAACAPRFSNPVCRLARNGLGLQRLPIPVLTRNQVELMQIDTVSSPDLPGLVELGISPDLRRGNTPGNFIDLMD